VLHSCSCDISCNNVPHLITTEREEKQTCQITASSSSIIIQNHNVLVSSLKSITSRYPTPPYQVLGLSGNALIGGGPGKGGMTAQPQPNSIPQPLLVPLRISCVTLTPSWRSRALVSTLDSKFAWLETNEWEGSGHVRLISATSSSSSSPSSCPSFPSASSASVSSSSAAAAAVASSLSAAATLLSSSFLSCCCSEP